MNLLITNDDGIDSEGIAVLARAATAFGKVTVVAPAAQCSAMSHKITIHGTLVMEKVDFPVEGVDAYRLTGTPADCVKAALDTGVLVPDVVLSGINKGYNVGFDVVYSGTVGAAMEALLNGIPAIALSKHHVGSFANAEACLHEILDELLKSPCLPNEIWNVNFPTGECRGILRDRTVAHMSYYEGHFEIEHAGENLALTYPQLDEPKAEKLCCTQDSDLYAVANGYISIGKVGCSVL